MSGKDFKRGSGRRDRISELSDDIIVYILSFLPSKEAAATSLLSPRWSHLWRYTTNLIFKNHRDDKIINKYDDIEWVNSVLNSHKALSLNQFAISFYIHRQYRYQFLTKCLSFAFSRRVESLTLDLHCASYVLDCNILSSIHISDYGFLKELKLESLNVSSEAIELFLRNCPLLERLILCSVDLTSDLVVGTTALKYLEIVSGRDHGISIKVSALNLTRLGYCCYDLRSFFLENVPNLIEATFHLRGPHDTMHHFAKAASRLETLILSLSEPRVFPVPQMPRLRKLLVDILFTKKEFWVPITRLIEASPCLEEFRLMITYLYRYISNRFSSMIEVPRAGNKFVRRHLKVFEFEGFCGSTADHIELVRYVRDSCSKGLQEIIITPMPVVRVLPYEEDDYMDETVCKESPYVVWTGSLDQDVIEAKVEEVELQIHKWTERVLAAALPKHIKLTVLFFFFFFFLNYSSSKTYQTLYPS